MMKRIVALLTACMAMVSIPATLRAAAPTVHAALSADTVLIGDRFTLEVTIDKDMMQVVSLPYFENKMLAPGIEILSESHLDTIATEGRRQTLRKVYDLTSFDAGAYDLGRYPVMYGDKNIVDTLESDTPLHIVIDTFPVDTQNNTVYDIKAPEQTPFMISEISGYVITALLAACVVAAITILVIRKLKRRRKLMPDGKPEPAIPPHVRAIQDLEELHNRKLWQSGKVKQYYTALTDIIRTYITERYGFGAMEMISDEIMANITPLGLPDKNRDELNRLLRTADLVKFAKHYPSSDENEELYYAAYYFVEDTKQQPETPDTGAQNTETGENPTSDEK